MTSSRGRSRQAGTNAAPRRRRMSPAMDIQVASNFERLYFEYAGRGNRQTAEAFAGFEATGSLQIPAPALAAMRAIFAGVSASESETARAIAETLRATGQLVDPHTAVALAGLDRMSAPPPGVPLVVLATAHAAKFPEAVTGRQRRHAGAPGRRSGSGVKTRAVRPPARRCRGGEGLRARISRPHDRAKGSGADGASPLQWRPWSSAIPRRASRPWR